MPRALVLGGAGFIGYHLSLRLVEEGYEITIVDDLSRGRLDSELSTLAALYGVKFVHADLTRRGALDALPHGWDQVYMLAAVVGVRNVERDPSRVIRVNTLALLNVLDWLSTDEQVLFFASTSETYAGSVILGAVPVPTPEDVPLTILDIGAPRFAYAVSKVLGEAAVIHVACERNLRYVIGRFHNVYGPRMGADHVIPELCLRALRRENPFVLYGSEQRRAFCYIGDAVDAMLRLMTTRAAWGQVVNIGNDDEETLIDDLMHLVLEFADLRPVIDSRPAPAGSVARRCPKIDRLRALTEFRPRVTLAEGVETTYRWYKRHYESHSQQISVEAP